MSAKTDTRRNQLRANLLALSEACPFDHRNPSDCPLFELRKMKPRQRVQWFKVLDAHDLAFLAAYHQVCLTTKIRAVQTP
jgi:hypothetical protein